MVGLVVIAGWVVVLTVAFNLVLANRLSASVDDTLLARAEAASATLEVDNDGQASLTDATTDAALDATTWLYAGGVALERGRGGDAVQEQADLMAARGLGGTIQRSGDDDAHYLALPVRSGGRVVAVVVAAASVTSEGSAARTALWASIVLGVLVLVGAYPALWWSAARALRPVDAMARQASDWSAHALSERFGHEQEHEELVVLAGSLDDLLDRIGAVLRHEQLLAAELSHELRTPLARIIAEVDLLGRRPRAPEVAAAAHAVIASSAEEMDEIIETLLTAARAEATTLPGVCDVRSAVEVAAGRPTSHPGVPIDVLGPSLRGGAESAVLERILAPLLDNATRFAATRVTVTIGNGAGLVTIDVRDDGPGIADAERNLVFEPGYRRADGVSQPETGHAGAGLGLPLARRLARAVGGDVTVLPGGPGAGLRVVVPKA
jgi:two-component system heavy metal sensor histidine kinase CusS